MLNVDHITMSEWEDTTLEERKKITVITGVLLVWHGDRIKFILSIHVVCIQYESQVRQKRPRDLRSWITLKRPRQ